MNKILTKLNVLNYIYITKKWSNHQLIDNIELYVVVNGLSAFLDKIREDSFFQRL